MIDARAHHNPDKVPGLITKAIEAKGSQKELAACLGVTPRYLQQLTRKERDASYAIQVALEVIISC